MVARREPLAVDPPPPRPPPGAVSPLLRLRSKLVHGIAAAGLPSHVLFSRGASTSRRVALTFDDGPDDMTPRYIEVLERLRVRATFFLVGRLVEARPDLAWALVGAGHEVAGHGFSHRPFPSLAPQVLNAELVHTTDVLPPSPIQRPLVRPPRGATSLSSLLRVAAAGFTSVLWSLDSDDCRTKDPREVERRVSPANVRPGEIVLMHEGQTWTLEALPAIVEGLRGAGYELVTAGELLEGRTA